MGDYREPEDAMTPQEQVDAARDAMSRRQCEVYEPSGLVPKVGIAVLLAMVLPVSFSLLLSGAASTRGETLPALLGYGGDDATYPALLWVARAGFAVIVLTGIGLWHWRAREERRFEHRKRGFGEL